MGQRYREKDISLYDAETACRQIANWDIIPGFIGRYKFRKNWFRKGGIDYVPITRQERMKYRHSFRG